jgi:hypothetical protein
MRPIPALPSVPDFLSSTFLSTPDVTMPIDFSFESTPNFRDLTQTGLLLLRQPVVRSLAKLRRLRRGQAVPEGPVLRSAKIFVGAR